MTDLMKKEAAFRIHVAAQDYFQCDADEVLLVTKDNCIMAIKTHGELNLASNAVNWYEVSKSAVRIQ